MWAPFDAALSALRHELGSVALELVSRTEVRDGSIVFTLEGTPEPRCFRWNADGLVRLVPEYETTVKGARSIVERCRGDGGRILSWRPGRRLVARIDVGDEPCIVKAWKRGRALRAMRTQAAAREALAGTFEVPSVIAVDSALDTAEMSVCCGSGIRLDDADVVKRIGRGIGVLQRDLDAVGFPRHGREEELRVLAQLADAYRFARGQLPQGFESIIERLEPAAHDGPEPTVAAHRDLHDGQFVIDGHKIALLDFDLAARSEPELDPANLCVHASWCGIQGTRGVDRDTSRHVDLALLAGFGCALDARAFAFYRATTALRLALVWGMRPRWSTQVGSLIELAQAAEYEVARA